MLQRRSALFAMENNNYQRQGTFLSEKKCFECGKMGHLKAFYPEKAGGGRGRGYEWHGRGRGRTHNGRGFGRGCEMRPAGGANASAMTEDATRTMNIEMNVEDWEKWCQFKGMSLGNKPTMEGTSVATSAASTNFSGTKEGTSVVTSAASANFSGTWDWKKVWDREHA